MSGPRRPARGLTPVVGVALLVVIAVLLTVVTAGFVLDLSEERDPAPNVALDLEREEGTVAARHLLVHTDGDVLTGERVEIRGVADPDGLTDSELAAGDRQRVYPVETTVRVVWYGDHGSSYVLREFEVDPADTVPEPDEGCAWVQSESNGGVDDVTVDDLVVNCDIRTDKVITVRNDGAVIGDTLSDLKELDVDDGRIYGDIVAEDVVNVQDGTVAGSATSETGDVKVDGSDVGGSVDADREVDVINDGSVEGDIDANGGIGVQDSSVAGAVTSDTDQVKVDASSVGGGVQADLTVEVTNDGSVGGDAVSDGGQVKVISGGDVSGSVTGDSVKLQDATVGGDVYVDPSDFDCSGSTIDGQDCSEYSPRPPGEYDG